MHTVVRPIFTTHVTGNKKLRKQLYIVGYRLIDTTSYVL